MHGVNIQKSCLKCQPVEAAQGVHCAVALQQQCPELCGHSGCRSSVVAQDALGVSEMASTCSLCLFGHPRSCPLPSNQCTLTCVFPEADMLLIPYL